MSALEVKIPDMLLTEATDLAAKENVSVDQIVTTALVAHVSAPRARESLGSRANRVDWQKVDDIRSRAPSGPPVPGDEIP